MVVATVKVIIVPAGSLSKGILLVISQAVAIGPNSSSQVVLPPGANQTGCRME